MQEIHDRHGTLDCEEAIIRAAMNHGIRAPLAALTAAMEFMSGDLQADDPYTSIISGVLDELDRLGRNVETLYRHSVPPALQPLRCSVEEICRSTIATLPEADARRVWLAIDDVDHHLLVDGPVLMDCLAAFLEDAVSRGSEEVLFHAHQSKGATFFAIVDDLVSDAELPALLESIVDDDDAPESFPVQLAKRDVQRMEGSVTITRSTPNQSCVMVRFDNVGGDEGR